MENEEKILGENFNNNEKAIFFNTKEEINDNSMNISYILDEYRDSKSKTVIINDPKKDEMEEEEFRLLGLTTTIDEFNYITFSNAISCEFKSETSEGEKITWLEFNLKDVKLDKENTSFIFKNYKNNEIFYEIEKVFYKKKNDNIYDIQPFILEPFEKDETNVKYLKIEYSTYIDKKFLKIYYKSDKEANETFKGEYDENTSIVFILKNDIYFNILIPTIICNKIIEEKEENNNG